MSLEEAVNWTKQILPIFENAGVKLIRVGLHPSEGLLTGEELIAGPFHISFRELVLTEIWNDKLKPLLIREGIEKLKIMVPFGSLNHAIGYNARNKKMLLRKFKSVSFYEGDSYSVFTN